MEQYCKVYIMCTYGYSVILCVLDHACPVHSFVVHRCAYVVYFKVDVLPS